ncbi:MAG: leucine-rich repeat domain-containing protein [Clostridia bacterium]|nr:leucine-rich repeat domain-containing protein [Clostridia bacterium]
MKKDLKKGLMLIMAVVALSVCFVFGVSAEEQYTEGYYTYTVTGGEATIIDVYESISGDVVIPDTLGGYEVAVIGPHAFHNIKNITSVMIPDSVISIKNSAFSGCDGLKEIYIPENVKAIESGAFSFCKNLQKITVNSDNESYVNDEFGALFDKNMTEIIQYPIGSENSEYSIPYGVEKICSAVFLGAVNLTDVVIPDTVEIVGSSAFSQTKLLTLILPEGITEIGEGAFSYSEIRELVIPDSVRSIGYNAFWGTNLSKIFIPENVEYIGQGALFTDDIERIEVDKNNVHYSSDEKGVLFDKNKTKLIQYPSNINLSEYTIPDSVVKIGYQAFSGCCLTSISLPEKVSDIEGFAFEGSELTEVIMDKNIKYIGEMAFVSCYDLKNIYYRGSESQWNEIEDESKYILEEVAKHYNYNPDIPHYFNISSTATCTEDGLTVHTCWCGAKYTEFLPMLNHKNAYATSEQKANCVEDGYTEGVFCPDCKKYINGHSTIPAKGHTDNNADGYCDNCGAETAKACSCNCHKGGFMGFIWKILRFFQKLFKTNQYCACGVAHY